jgi:hypothetical protein
MMFLWNTAILILSRWTFGCAVKSAITRPPLRKGTSRNGDSGASLALLGFAFLQNKISFNCRE